MRAVVLLGLRTTGSWPRLWRHCRRVHVVDSRLEVWPDDIVHVEQLRDSIHERDRHEDNRGDEDIVVGRVHRDQGDYGEAEGASNLRTRTAAEIRGGKTGRLCDSASGVVNLTKQYSGIWRKNRKAWMNRPMRSLRVRFRIIW